FDVSNTDHVMPVNIGDRVSLLCPRPGEDYEYSNIYAVTSIGQLSTSLAQHSICSSVFVIKSRIQIRDVRSAAVK
ncbi:hypothetical protein ANCDUO_22718, partial [Ancylostoma duodenale]